MCSIGHLQTHTKKKKFGKMIYYFIIMSTKSFVSIQDFCFKNTLMLSKKKNFISAKLFFAHPLECIFFLFFFLNIYFSHRSIQASKRENIIIKYQLLLKCIRSRVGGGGSANNKQKS